MKRLLSILFCLSLLGVANAQDFTINGINYSATSSTQVQVTSGSCFTGDLSLPETVENAGVNYDVTRLANGAFSGCTDLTSITFPSTVIAINDNAFDGCIGLVSVVIPESVTTISRRTFKGCTSLSSISIPNTVTNMEDFAFQSCTSLTSIDLPNNVEILKSGLFFGSGLTSITLPSSVTTIQDDVFNACSDLASISIPSGVDNIGEGAFKSCASLTSITLPSAIDEIREATFQNSGLTSIDLPAGVEEIGLQAFEDCDDLQTVTMGNNVTTIGINAFQRCTSLTSVTLSTSLLQIRNRAFQDCFNLTSIDIPNSVSIISSYAFYRCVDLETVTLPNSLTTLSAFVFDSCTSLTELEIPESVTTIEDFSLSNSGLQNVTVNWTTPVAITDDVFQNVTLSTAELIVPDGTTSTYQAADVWQDFGNISAGSGGGGGGGATVSIPDVYFEEYLESIGAGNGVDFDGLADLASVQALTSVDVSNLGTVEDLTGIEEFTAMTYLNASGNSIESVDLSANTNLVTLDISNNMLTTLDVSSNVNLQSLSVSNNSLTSLDVSDLSDLEILRSNSNQLTELSVFQNTKLTELNVSSNSLTDLNLLSNVNLEQLYAESNSLEYLDLSQNSSLTTVTVILNSLIGMNIKNGNNTAISNSSFAAFDNPSLTCIQVDDVSYSMSNWGQIDMASSFSENCIPVNDDCSYTIPITLGQDTPGDTTSASAGADNPNCAQSGIVLFDVWYEVAAPASGSIVLNLSAQPLIAKIAIYETCSDAEPFACDEDTLSVNDLTPGQIYYLRVWLETNADNSTGETGSFTLNAQDPEVLSTSDIAEISSGVEVFPNPVSDRLTIRLTEEESIETIEVYSLVGTRVLRQKGTTNQLDLNLLPTGMYIVQVETSTDTYFKKILKK